MSQINLLKQTSGPGNIGNAASKIAVWVFVAILSLLIIYYAWIFFDFKSTENKIGAQQTAIETGRKTALDVEGRSEVLTRQQQIAHLESLVGAHPYWSYLLPQLAEVTLRSASYSSLRAGPDDTITLSVNVPSVADFDKYTQVFDISDFNRNFFDVRVSGFSKVQGETSTSIQFAVQMKFDKQIIQYKTPEQGIGIENLP